MDVLQNAICITTQFSRNSISKGWFVLHYITLHEIKSIEKRRDSQIVIQNAICITKVVSYG